MKTTKLIAAMLVAAFVAIYTPSVSLAEEGGSVGGEIFKGSVRASWAGLQQLFDLYTVHDWLLGRTTSSSWALMAFGLTIMLIMWKLKRKNWFWLTVSPYLIARFILFFVEADPEADMGMTAIISCLSLLPVSLVAFFTWNKGLLFAFNKSGDTLGQKFLSVLIPWRPSPFYHYFATDGYKKTYEDGNEEEDEDEEHPPKSKSDECPDCPKPNRNLGKKYCTKCDYVRPDPGSKVQLDECPDCPKPNRNLGKKYCTKCDYVRPDPTKKEKEPPKDPPSEAPPQTEEYDPEDLDDD